MNKSLVSNHKSKQLNFRGFLVFFLILILFSLTLSPALAVDSDSEIGYNLETGYNKYLSNQEKIDIFLKNQKKTTTLSSGYDKLSQRILAPEFEIVSIRTRQITAYNVGDASQTDDTPCTAANGENICTALNKGYKRCAANFVRFGTRLEIEGYGRCVVTDRMNARYTTRVDIAMPVDQKFEARQWGLQRRQVKILAMK